MNSLSIFFPKFGKAIKVFSLTGNFTGIQTALMTRTQLHELMLTEILKMAIAVSIHHTSDIAFAICRHHLILDLSYVDELMN